MPRLFTRGRYVSTKSVQEPAPPLAVVGRKRRSEQIRGGAPTQFAGRRVLFRTGIWMALALVFAADPVQAFAQKVSQQSAYRLAVIEKGDITRSVVASGILNPVEIVEVSSQLSGQVAGLTVDFNDRVRRGQELARLDDATYAAVVAKMRGELQVAAAGKEAAAASVLAAKARHDEAGRDFRSKLSLQLKGTVSKRELDNAKAAADEARADLAAARANVDLQIARISVATAQLDEAGINLARTIIRAPIDGIVIRRSVDLGQTVAASLQAPTLFTIAKDLVQMEVTTFVNEADIGLIRRGQRALFTVDAYPARGFAGVVMEIRKSPQVIENVTTYPVILSVSNPDDALLPGMTAEVHVIVAERKNVLKVPNAALRFFPAGQQRPSNVKHGTGLLWVLNDDGGLSSKQVDLGYSDNAFTEINGNEVRAGQRSVIGYQSRNSRRDSWLEKFFKF